MQMKPGVNLGACENQVPGQPVDFSGGWIVSCDGCAQPVSGVLRVDERGVVCERCQDAPCR